MATSIKTKIRAKAKEGITTVTTMITHPMETGMRKNKETGDLIPAHFIQHVTGKHNGKEVLSVEMGGTVSTPAYLSFKIEGGAKGDEVEISWADNTGGSDSTKAKIK